MKYKEVKRAAGILLFDLMKTDSLFYDYIKYYKNDETVFNAYVWYLKYP